MSYTDYIRDRHERYKCFITVVKSRWSASSINQINHRTAEKLRPHTEILYMNYIHNNKSEHSHNLYHVCLCSLSQMCKVYDHAIFSQRHQEAPDVTYIFRITISFLAAFLTFLPSFLWNFLQVYILKVFLSFARNISQNSSLRKTQGRNSLKIKK